MQHTTIIMFLLKQKANKRIFNYPTFLSLQTLGNIRRH